MYRYFWRAGFPGHAYRKEQTSKLKGHWQNNNFEKEANVFVFNV